MNAVPPKPNDKLILGGNAFGQGKLPAKELPDFTMQDLSEMGVSFIESDETRVLTIPFGAQKRLVEVLKPYGFGSAHALDLLLKKILGLYGFTGRVQTRAEEGTFAWVAHESKKEIAAPAAAATKQTGSDSEAVTFRDEFALIAFRTLISFGSDGHTFTELAALTYPLVDAALARRESK